MYILFLFFLFFFFFSFPLLLRIIYFLGKARPLYFPLQHFSRSTFWQNLSFFKLQYLHNSNLLHFFKHLHFLIQHFKENVQKLTTNFVELPNLSNNTIQLYSLKQNYLFHYSLCSSEMLNNSLCQLLHHLNINHLTYLKLLCLLSKLFTTNV